MKIFSDAVGIQFGLEKCAKVKYKKGSLRKCKSITLDINTEITDLECNKTNKYFGINEMVGVNQTTNMGKKQQSNYVR